MSSVLEIARPDLIGLQPYQHAAWEPTLERLHANELPWRPSGDNSRAGLNRYPEPQPRELVLALARHYGVRPEQLLVGRGSDEAIDLLVRGFCRAERDRIMVFPPTFGMYKVAAKIQGAGVVEVPLDQARGFALDEGALIDQWQSGTKILFFCSPNNPTGNLLDSEAIKRMCARLSGQALVVVDEAYVEFAGTPSLSATLGHHDNLVVLRTLSKAHALAGARCGALLGDPALVDLLKRMIPPYALPAPTIEAALHALEAPQLAFSSARRELIVAERARLAKALARVSIVRKIWPSAANYLLIECVDPERAFRAAIAAGLLIRDVRSYLGLGSHLRVSIGTPEQNDRLLQALEAA
jgi:histidinol-phosphate aminotransferase